MKKSSIYLCLILLMFAFLGMHKSFAQVNAYSFSQLLSTYVPLSGTPTVAYAAPWDDTSSPIQVSIPFSFTFDGSSYTQCTISPNGFITFGGVLPAANNYSPLVDVSFYNGAISALGMDLVSNGSPIVYGIEGSFPNRSFIIQWTNVTRKLYPGNFNFQIRLSESTNIIDFVYGSCLPENATEINTQVGLRGPNNVGVQGNINTRQQGSGTLWYNQTFNNTISAGFLKTSDSAYPEDGLNFKYTPASTCVTPAVIPTNLIIGGTAITDTSFTGNSFTPPIPAPSNYLILRSTINIPPTSLTIVNRSYYISGASYGNYYVVGNITGTTFSQTGLAPTTTYYYWIIPYNNACTGAPFYNLNNVLTASATTCFSRVNAANATLVGGNSFTANWTAVAGAAGYAIDVSTSNTFTSMLPGYNNLQLGSGVTSLLITNLLPVTTYYYRLRAFSSTPSCLLNSVTITVSTICGYFLIPYTQNFDSFSTGVLPTCFTRYDINGDGLQWETQNINYASSSRSLMINKNPAIAMNDWFFIPGLNLTGGVSYRLFFRYNTGNISNTSENLKVQLGSGANSAAMTQTLLDLQNISNSNYEIAVVDFVPASTGIYYIGFQGYSNPNQSYIVIDDISVTVSPTCFEPINLSVSSVGSNSLTLTWSPPNPVPSNGYEYFISTSSTPPNASTVPTGSVGAGITSALLSGLQSSTLYYVWVRGNCGTGDKSVWSLIESFNTQCSTPTIINLSSANRCGYGAATIFAIPSSGASTNWYETDTDYTILATGNSFTTPLISSNTTYFAQAKSSGVIEKLGPVSPMSIGGPQDVLNYQASIYFTITTNTNLISLDIFPMVSGESGKLVIRNSNGIQVAEYPFTTSVSGGNMAQIIPINHQLLSGNYSFYFSVVPFSGIKMNSDFIVYPFNSSVADITGNSENNSMFLGLYNWKFTTECLSPRTPISVTVTTPPNLTISSNSNSICSGSSTNLITVTGYSSYENLVWFPSTGISGNFSSGFTFNPTENTVYTLTATQTSQGFCGNQITNTITLKPVPSPVILTPNIVSVCENNVQSLNGSSGAGTTATIFSENFNGLSNNWAVANTSYGGDVSASQWTLRPNNYRYINSFGWDVTFTSNDATQFYIANSDSQSGTVGSITQTTLTSPSINLVGYTSATISFWHYLRYITGDIVAVEVSTDDGLNWSPIRTYISSQGSASNFSNNSIDIGNYIGTSNFKFRFSFTSEWGYAWAIDNISISGLLATGLTWSPATNLFTDSAATIPYVLGTSLGVVYTKPNSNITYTATITSYNGCSQSSIANVTLVLSTQPGLLSSNQKLCSGNLASDITLTGNIGAILRWEYADDANFTINVNSISNTSNTLTALQMGTFSTIRYFRALVKNGSCNQLFSNVVSVEYPSSTWNGSVWSNGVPDANTKVVFNGNYSSSADLYACSVVINSGIVTVNSNHNFIVSNSVSVLGGSLIFENNSSLVQINNSVNSGTITYKRTTTPMKKYDYTYWSTPVNPQTLINLSPLTLTDKFFIFNPTIAYWSSANSSAAMEIAKGYIVRAPQTFNPTTPAVFNAVFNGTPNNGTITTPILASTSPYNLIGNPYPSAISANSFLSSSLNNSVVDGTIYLWTHNTAISNLQYTSNDYAVYNYLGGTGTISAPNLGVNNSVPSGKIAAGQSFFVKGLSNGTATFLNSMRIIGNNNQFFKGNFNSLTDQSEENRIWLEVKDSQGGYKQTLVGYSAQASYEIDRGYDSDLMNLTPTSIYSLLGSNKLSIQGRPMPFLVTDEVPIGFHADLSGSFSIGLYDFDGIFNNQDIFLQDNQTNQIYNLKQGEYNFISNSGTFENRFVLLYQNATTLNNSSSVFDANSIVLYKPNQDLNIDSGSFIMKKVRVFDARGRLVLEKQAINSSKTSINMPNNLKFITLEITSQDGQLVFKKYLN